MFFGCVLILDFGCYVLHGGEIGVLGYVGFRDCGFLIGMYKC